MSRTRPARAANSATSSSGRPNSLTRVAPGAEKRSVICVVIAALCSEASRSSRPTREPMRRAGITNSGSRASASTVICHDRLSITPTVSTSAMTLVTTPDSAEVNARWAPMTSLFKRLTRAPVWVRVKKAIGIDCTWANTRRRRSRISPSPSRADSSRSSSPTAASTTATTAMSTAIPMTTPVSRPSTMASTARPASRGDGDPEHRRQGGEGEERGDRAPVWAGEPGDAAPGGPTDLAARPIVLHRALQRRPHREIGHDEHPKTSSFL